MLTKPAPRVSLWLPQLCMCKSCRDLQGDAAADGEFTTIAAAATSSGANAAVFAPINAASRRRLTAASNDEVRQRQ